MPEHLFYLEYSNNINETIKRFDELNGNLKKFFLAKHIYGHIKVLKLKLLETRDFVYLDFAQIT
jgi:hypothetical protein